MQSVLNSLSRCALFQGFSEAGLQRAAEVCHRKRFNEGELIYASGTSRKALTVVVSGSVRITSSAASGKESILIVFGADNWFGDAVFCKTAPRLYNAFAHESVELLDFSETVISELMRQHPECYPAILDQVALRSCATATANARYALLSIPARVGRSLLSLMIFQSKGGLTDQAYSLKMTQEQLGSMVGMTRQGVNKAIKTLEEAELIRLTYGKITLENPLELERFLSDMEEA